MGIFLGILLVLALISSFSFYYCHLIKRVYSVFKKDIIRKERIIFIFFSIILSILSFNLFSIYGLFLMHFIFISLFLDMIVFFVRRIHKSFDKKIVSKIYKSSIVPIFITLVLFIYGFFNIRNIIEVRYTIYTDKNIEDMRILLITDSHYGDVFDKERLDKLKNRLDEVDADIVVLGGDIVDESTTKDEMNYIFEVFGNIKNKYGIYYVYGNHDEQQYNLVTSYSDEELNNVIVDNDIVILEDSYLEIMDNVVVMGRNDYSMGRKDISSYGALIDKENYIIMVDHQSVEYDENIDFGVDLIMSGHTHGGQIFPVEAFIKLLKTADLSYGYKNVEGMDAIVSSGVCGWGYPIRTQKHSEYVVIEVKKK